MDGPIKSGLMYTRRSDSDPSVRSVVLRLELMDQFDDYYSLSRACYLSNHMGIVVYTLGTVWNSSDLLS
jgi:hypothetical protein